jgi:hypothetical protein
MKYVLHVLDENYCSERWKEAELQALLLQEKCFDGKEFFLF